MISLHILPGVALQQIIEWPVLQSWFVHFFVFSVFLFTNNTAKYYNNITRESRKLKKTEFIFHAILFNLCSTNFSAPKTSDSPYSG